MNSIEIPVWAEIWNKLDLRALLPLAILHLT
jgi:hypothetical protein